MFKANIFKYMPQKYLTPSDRVTLTSGMASTKLFDFSRHMRSSSPLMTLLQQGLDAVSHASPVIPKFRGTQLRENGSFGKNRQGVCARGTGCGTVPGSTGLWCGPQQRSSTTSPALPHLLDCISAGLSELCYITQPYAIQTLCFSI